MACQQPGQRPVTKERGFGPPGGSLPRASTTRRWLRLAATAVAVGAGWLVTVPAAAAPDAGAGAVLSAAASQPGARSHPWIAITSLSPATATPKGKVVVSGIVANPTSAALQGLTVRLWSSNFALSSRSAMNGYLDAANSPGLDAQVPVGAPLTLPGRVPPHGTQEWTLTLNVAQTGMQKFGVYPLAAQLSSSVGSVVDVARTFLPFWPGKHAARTVNPLTFSWVWCRCRRAAWASASDDRGA